MVIQLQTKSEEFASKKNNAEESKLKDTIESICVGNELKKDEINEEIRELRKFLKDIKSCTGHSLNDARVISWRVESRVTDTTSVSYNIPHKIRTQSSSRKSGLVGRKLLFHELNAILGVENRGISFPSIKQRALTAGGEIGRDKVRENNARKVKSEAGEYRFMWSRSGQTRESTMCLHDDDVMSSVFYEEEEGDNQDEESIKEKRQLYNPWNIQNRRGPLYDALELPIIKDCYRPLCRPNCNTCLMRKKKGPCFLVPGLVAMSHDSPRYQPKTAKTTRKKRRQHVVHEKNETMSKTTGVDDSKDVENELKELFIPKPERDKGISLQRINELARPRGGAEQPVRFSKAFLKRKVNELQNKNSSQQLSAIEKENRRKIQSKVGMFLAYLNLQQTEQKPTKMVDIPLRDDLLNSHTETVHPFVATSNSVVLPSFQKKRRKVNFR